ncbi:MAG: diguanylate cyclase [Deltaproteobacteria bacterium]
MTFPLFPLFHTIRFKLMSAMFVVLTVSIGTAVFGIWTYEKETFLASTQREAMRAGEIIEKSLRTAMLNNDRQAIQSSIKKISEILDQPSRITIVAPDGSVAFASDRTLVGTVFIRPKNPTCNVCHLHDGTAPKQNAILLNTKSGPMLRDAIKITSQPACLRCHAANRKILGVLLFDSYVKNSFQMLRTVTIRIFLTGALTFLVIIVVLTWLVNRLIHRPIQDMTKGFAEVGRGNFAHWVEIHGNGEFAEMADSFNVMSRAVGRYLQEIKARSAEISTLYSVVQRMGETINLVELTEIVFDLFQKLSNFDEVLLLLAEENRADRFEIFWRRGEEARLHHQEINQKGTRLPGTTLRAEDLHHWSEDGMKQPIFLNHDSRALLPLFYNNKRIGLICLRLPAEETITFQEKKLIGALANHAAISFANARLYYLATTDGLTGLYTKRHFLETINHLISPGPALAKSFWLMMIDIDHFKEINDTYGHPVGDQMLRQIADLIRENIRYGDAPCRYGGEEFILVLPEADGDETRIHSIANRLRKVVEEYSFIYQDYPPIHLTISIGIASFPGHATSVDEVIKAADCALYAAKNGGKNQVRYAPFPPKIG